MAANDRLIFRAHALQRMVDRGFRIEDVESALEQGEIIESYPDDFPYPSQLVLGRAGIRPIHVVCAYNAVENETIIITVYEPDAASWTDDFRMRLQ